MNKYDKRQNEDLEEQYIIEGRNSVFEAVRTGRELNKILFCDGGGNLNHILAAAKAAGIPTSKCDRRKLDSISVSGAHQGVLAYA